MASAAASGNMELALNASFLNEDEAQVHSSSGGGGGGGPLPQEVYLPEFYSNLDAYSVEDLIKNMDWLTDGLKLEIERYYPNQNERDPVTHTRSMDAFVEKAGLLFPPNRVFASFKQLHQALKHFLGAWGVSCSHGSKRICCSLSHLPQKKVESMVQDESQRKRTSLKNDIQCPFLIRYSYIGYRKSENKKYIFHKVKITNCNYQHSHELSPISHRQGLKITGKLTPNLDDLQNIISFLRESPRLDSKALRPMLEKSLPHFQSIDAKFIGNFRKKALKHILNPDHSMTTDDLMSLASARPFAANESIAIDSPVLKQNFTELLRKIMSDDGVRWKCQLYLEELKKTVIGFDFRIKYDSQTRPEAIVWMLPTMRRDLIRFGDVLFLDAQKRQFNSHNWPYIGPSLKEHEKQVCVGAESICIEESTRMYVWVLRSMEAMEPRWQLSKVKLIFADQLTDETLLEHLGITNSCVLRGDYYHLTEQVWPEKFGSSTCAAILPYLKKILSSRTQEGFESAYKGAKNLLLNDPAKLQALDEIHDNASYYAGYILCSIEGNLKAQGSVTAEQNHSSIIAFMGDGANFSIAEQVKELVRRQQHKTRQRNAQEEKNYVSASGYKSPLSGTEGRDDELAKKEFGVEGYKLTEDRRRKASYLQLSCNPSGFTTGRLFRT